MCIRDRLSYAIGVAHPTSIMVDTFGTGKVSDEKLVEIIRENFDLRPAGITKMLDLRRPIYKQTAAYEMCIRDRCKTGVCTNLRQFQIDLDICKGCSKCARNCPAGAIEGELKSPYHINQEKCIKCGACMEQCPFKAISVAR